MVYSTSWMPAVFCQLAYFRSLVWKFATFVQKVVVLLLKKSVLSVRTGFFLSCAPAVFCQLVYIYATFVVKVVDTFCSKKWFAQINQSGLFIRLGASYTQPALLKMCNFPIVCKLCQCHSDRLQKWFCNPRVVPVLLFGRQVE